MRTSDKEIQKRLDETLDYLVENGETHIEDLASFLSVSPLTIRRNIAELQKQNIIELKNSTVSLSEYAQRKWWRLKNKSALDAIQRKAASLIKDNDVIYINTSYTALGVIKYINVPCTIITNNINVANIERSSFIKVVLTGGELHQTRSSIVGESAIKMINANRANKCIVGINALDVEAGLTANDFQEASLTGQMIDSCTDDVILVSTSDKFSASAPFFVSSIDKIDTFITDTQINQLTLQSLRDTWHINVIMAS